MGNKRGGLLFGVIVGTLLGVLFAPRKGKELRKQFKDELTKGGVGVETLKKNFKDMGQDVTNTAQEVYYSPDVQKAVKEGKKIAGEGVERAEKYLGIDDEQLHEISGKIHQTGKKVQGQLHSLRNKFMGDLGFKKKPLHSPKNKKAKKSNRREASNTNKKHPRTKTVKIKKR